MEIKTFRARSMQAALARVREELGPDAAILETRPIRNGIGRFLAGDRIEVTASSSISVPSRWFESQAGPPEVRCDNAKEERIPPASAGSSQLDRSSRLGLEKRNTSKIEVPDPEPGVTPPSSMSEARWWKDLLSMGFPPDCVDQLLDQVIRPLLGSASLDEQLVRGKLIHWMQRQIPTAPTWKENPVGNARRIAFVGPTGSGKTSSLVKLAATIALESKQRVAILTLDTHRLGAMDQLRRYVDILHMPLLAAETETQVEEAKSEWSSYDFVLVDTIGGSPKERQAWEHQLRLLQSLAPEETHLVIDAKTSARQFDILRQRYAEAGTNRLILTKLDEICGTGELFPLLCDEGLPMSYVTTGTRVPNDFASVRETRLAAFLLGQCVEFGKEVADTRVGSELS